MRTKNASRLTCGGYSRITEIGESMTVEWKQSLSEIKEIIPAAAAFANTEGGAIFVDVSKDGKPIGVSIGKDTIENFVNNIAQHAEPKLYPRIIVAKVKDKEIIVIEVKASHGKLVLVGGRPYVCVGKPTRQMSKDEHEHRILEKHKDNLQFDKDVCREAKLKDIDNRKVEVYLKLGEKNRNISSKIKMPLNRFLVNIKEISEAKPTNAGILFFARPS